jgi:hypothetical protein
MPKIAGYEECGCALEHRRTHGHPMNGIRPLAWSAFRAGGQLFSAKVCDRHSATRADVICLIQRLEGVPTATKQPNAFSKDVVGVICSARLAISKRLREPIEG